MNKIVLLVSIQAAAAVLSGTGAFGADFLLPSRGCPMAHCDGAMSDFVNMVVPVKPVIRYHDAAQAGSEIGLGCSSNGTVVACTYRNQCGPNLVVYNAHGGILYTSGSLLNSTAIASAPIVDAAGGVIVADNHIIMRFTPDGRVQWSTPTWGGTPISPVVTANGAVVIATYGGPVSAYQAATGEPVGSLSVTDSAGNAFQTRNTPSVNGNRVYVSMELQNDPNTGRLVAIDVDPSNISSPLTVRWGFDFGGPSGASPLFAKNVIYFDAAHLTRNGVAGPYAVAVRDLGNTYTVLWRTRMASAIKASPALDPRGGLWVYATGTTSLTRLDQTTGATLQTIDVNALSGEVGLHFPSSAMSIAVSPSGNPTMTVGIKSRVASVYVIDLAQSSLLWKLGLAEGVGINLAMGQFPIVNDELGQPVMVFSAYNTGAYFVGNSGSSWMSGQ